MRYGEDQLGHTAKEPGCTCDKWPMLPEKMYDDQISWGVVYFASPRGCVISYKTPKNQCFLYNVHKSGLAWISTIWQRRNTKFVFSSSANMWRSVFFLGETDRRGCENSPPKTLPDANPSRTHSVTQSQILSLCWCLWTKGFHIFSERSNKELSIWPQRTFVLDSPDLQDSPVSPDSPLA